MRHLLRFIALAHVTLLVAGCDSGNDEPSHSDRYAYTAFSEEGAVVAEGTIELELVVDDAPPYSRRLLGTKRVRAVEGVGPHGAGTEVRGSFPTPPVVPVEPQIDVVIQLNPNIADDNVELYGGYAEGDERIEGTWMWSTLSGVAASGPFELVLTQRATAARTDP